MRIIAVSFQIIRSGSDCRFVVSVRGDNSVKGELATGNQTYGLCSVYRRQMILLDSVSENAVALEVDNFTVTVCSLKIKLRGVLRVVKKKGRDEILNAGSRF